MQQHSGYSSQLTGGHFSLKQACSGHVSSDDEGSSSEAMTDDNDTMGNLQKKRRVTCSGHGSSDNGSSSEAN